jgi:hypothetical protein
MVAEEIERETALTAMDEGLSVLFLEEAVPARGRRLDEGEVNPP